MKPALVYYFKLSYALGYTFPNHFIYSAANMVFWHAVLTIGMSQGQLVGAQT